MTFERQQKWTPSTIAKFIDREWSLFLKEMLNNDKFTKEEKNWKINDCLELMKLIHDNSINGRWNWRKE